jgi:hypothetical protein
MVLRCEQLPDCAGVAATIVLHLTEEQVHTGTGLVTTGHGAHITVDQASTLMRPAELSLGGSAAAAAGRSALRDPGPLRRPTNRSCACRYAGD